MLEYQVVFTNEMLSEPLILVLTCETMEDMENWHEKLDEYIKKNNNLDAKTLLKEEKESVKRKMTLAKKHLRAQQAPQGSGVMRLPHNHNGSTFPLTLRMVRIALRGGECQISMLRMLNLSDSKSQI